MRLVDVCYEQIKDSYWYGIFGDFKFIIDKDTGYFNAAKLCKDGGKEFYHWLENKRSKELMDYYNSKSDDRNSECHFIVKGNKDKIYNAVISGTYVREELLLNIACWLSNDFYNKCYIIIRDYFVSDFKQYMDDCEQLEAKVKSPCLS